MNKSSARDSKGRFVRALCICNSGKFRIEAEEKYRKRKFKHFYDKSYYDYNPCPKCGYHFYYEEKN